MSVVSLLRRSLSFVVLVAPVVLSCADSPAGPSAASAVAREQSPVPGASYGEDLNNVLSDGPGFDHIPRPLPRGVLSFFLEPLPEYLPYQPVAYREELRSALAEWQRATSNEVSFAEVSDHEAAAVVIGFRTAGHAGSCDAGFRGAHVIAHAFSHDNGCLSGEIHVNSALPYLFNGNHIDGYYDLRTVAMHEVGHLLGLDHTDDRGHIMSGVYAGPRRTLTTREGQDAIRALEASEL